MAKVMRPASRSAVEQEAPLSQNLKKSAVVGAMGIQPAELVMKFSKAGQIICCLLGWQDRQCELDLLDGSPDLQ
jgi:hypothetical protein